MRRDECNDPIRRRELRREGRRKKVAGLASVEVVASDGELPDLLVTFAGTAPPKLTAEYFHITGGRKPRPPQVAALRRGETIGGDDRVLLGLVGEHDHSVYTLHLGAGNGGRIDPRHDRLDFVFDLDCPHVDCASECSDEDPPAIAEPDIDYLAKDYGSFRRLMLDRLSLLLPEWTERHEADLGIMLVELLAYVGDHISYQQDAVATEAYVGTARKRISIRRHARLVDYVLHEGCNARAFVCLSAAELRELAWGGIAFATDGTRERANGETFLPIQLGDRPTLRVHPELGEIEIYDWDGQPRKQRAGGQAPLAARECCLRRGSTSATLVLESNLLAVGDFLIFEEVLGPRTGRPSDADPKHRHVVRLTRVEKVEDPLETSLSLVEVAWGDEDALPFDLCLSAITAPPACRPLRRISVARGNVVLVDHGRWVPASGPPHDPLGVVPLADIEDRCDGPRQLCDEARSPARFRPSLASGPIVHRAPLPSPDPCLAADALPSASALLVQDPRAALPVVEVFEDDPLSRDGQLAWTPRHDLLRSGPADRHFVVEVDDDGVGWLRFGDGELGRHPKACATMTVRYRVGSGPEGNVGPDMITRIVSQPPVEGVVVRNPLAASGGTAPEPIERAREQLTVPMRATIQRAITAADYEMIAERDVPGLQNASADLLWNGSWYEAHVALDPIGHADLAEVTRCQAERVLERARRIGHDLSVGPARMVPLRIALHVCVEPRYLRASVRAEVLAVLGRGRLRDGSLGYFHPDRLSFGEPVLLSRIVARVATIPGVAAVRVQRFERLFEGTHGELERGYVPLARNEIARLDNDPVRPEHGILDVEVEGGR